VRTTGQALAYLSVASFT